MKIYNACSNDEIFLELNEIQSQLILIIPKQKWPIFSHLTDYLYYCKKHSKQLQILKKKKNNINKK